MKAEINNENKAKFFVQYWGQDVLTVGNALCENLPENWIESSLNHTQYLQLKPLSEISDEDAIEVARIAHQMPNSQFKVKRMSNSLIHVTHFQANIGLEKHISINKYGCINANWHFHKREGEEAKSFKVNIGEIQSSSKKPVPFIAIVDFLRDRGYLVPWMGMSCEELIEAGWAKYNTP